MFGLSSFSQVPFSSVAGGNLIVLSILENINLQDANSQDWAFLQNITEPFTITEVDSDAGGDIYILSINENIILRDTSSQISAFTVNY
jgi:hypothetical protein